MNDGDTEVPTEENLSDIQSYLVTFNKEIEGGEAPSFGVNQIATAITDVDQAPVETASAPVVSRNYETVYYEGQPLLPEEDPQTNDAEPGPIPIQSFVVNTNNSDTEEAAEISQDPNQLLEESQDADTKPVIVSSDGASILDASDQLSVVHAQIAELSGSGEVHVGADFASEHERVTTTAGTLQVSDGIIATSTNPDDHTVRMVAVDEVEAAAITSMAQEAVEVDISQLTAALQAGDGGQHAINQIGRIVHGGAGGTLIDHSDPVSVLASVAASSGTSVSSIPGISASQPDIHGAQLVALQSSDSSQPQLVAVQAPDGSGTETVQVIGASEASAIANGQMILNSSGTSYQTVTIMPSEVSQGGEVSYVLIVSQPEGEREGRSQGEDPTVYDYAREDGREVIEEIIDETGTSRKIIRLKMPGSPATSASSQLMCHYCNYTSPKRYLLTRHLKTHSQDRPHKCGICERGFKTLASLQNHVNTHTGIRPHKCRQCDSSFTTSGELVRHVRYRHSFEKPHKCTECDYASVELSKLKRHMRSHTGERPYHCPHCAYASPDAYKLKRHLRIHTGEKPYECDICQTRFTQSNSLKAHRLIHSGNKPVFQCELCPTTCGRRTDLKIHMQKLHTAEHPLQCKKCQQTFPDRYQFKVHMRAHDGEKCFKCDECDYAALSQRHLANHKLTHTGEKPFQCDHCELSFRQKQLLKRHMNLNHNEELDDSVSPSLKNRLFYCEECDRSFSNQPGFIKHMAQHADGKDQPQDTPIKDGSDPSTLQLQKTIRTEIQAGRLTNPAGNTPQVVIVHLDGTVEEVNPNIPDPRLDNIPDIDDSDDAEDAEDPEDETDPSPDADDRIDHSTDLVNLAMKRLQSTINQAVADATAEELDEMSRLTADDTVKMIQVGGKDNKQMSIEVPVSLLQEKIQKGLSGVREPESSAHSDQSAVSAETPSTSTGTKPRIQIQLPPAAAKSADVSEEHATEIQPNAQDSQSISTPETSPQDIQSQSEGTQTSPEGNKHMYLGRPHVRPAQVKTSHTSSEQTDTDETDQIGQDAGTQVEFESESEDEEVQIPGVTRLPPDDDEDSSSIPLAVATGSVDASENTSVEFFVNASSKGLTSEPLEAAPLAAAVASVSAKLATPDHGPIEEKQEPQINSLQASSVQARSETVASVSQVESVPVQVESTHLEHAKEAIDEEKGDNPSNHSSPGSGGKKSAPLNGEGDKQDVKDKPESATPRRRGRPPGKKTAVTPQANTKLRQTTTPPVTPTTGQAVRSRMTTRSSPQVTSPTVRTTNTPKTTPTKQQPVELTIRTSARKRKVPIPADEVVSPLKRSRRLELAAKEKGGHAKS